MNPSDERTLLDEVHWGVKFGKWLTPVLLSILVGVATAVWQIGLHMSAFAQAKEHIERVDSRVNSIEVDRKETARDTADKMQRMDDGIQDIKLTLARMEGAMEDQASAKAVRRRKGK